MTLSREHLLSGRYRLDEPIASGGMGTVWRATDELLGRLVAVKVLHSGGPVGGSTSAGDDFRARFRAEARSSAALSHPNIATVFDFGDDDAHPYLVMELVEGRSLAEVLAERGPFAAAEVTSIVGQAALALQVAHSAGVIHRDVKPANVMLTPAGLVKLTDFGIARAATGSGLTRTGEVLGTPHYLSPEQAQGLPATAASDVYALGVVGHELLTGTRPFEGESLVATALAHVTQPAPELPDAVPEPLRGAIMAALSKDPSQRPATAGDLAALLGMSGGPVTPVTGVEPVAGSGPSGLADPTEHLESGSAGPPTAVLPATAAAVLATAVPPTALPLTPVPATTGTSADDAHRRRRPWWLVPVGGVAAVLAIVVAVLLLGGSGDSGSRTPAQQPTAPVTTPVPSPPPSTTTSKAATSAATNAPAPAAKPSNTGKGQGKGGKKK